MPIYAYECENCGNEQEQIARSYDESIEPACSLCQFKMKRVMAKSHFRLVGPGWTGSQYSRYRQGLKDNF